MVARRLSAHDFARIQMLINDPTSGLTLLELKERRDFLLDLADMVTDANDKALYRIWAGNLETEIRKLTG